MITPTFPFFIWIVSLIWATKQVNLHKNRKDSSRLSLQEELGEGGVPGYKWDEPVQ